MSNQSGIIADQDLLNKISVTLNDASLDPVVVAQISNDTTIEFVKSLPSTQDLHEHVSSDNKPQYIFVRDGNQLHFIAYVPDNSQIRLKMLYASTKGTLLRQVGSNHIAKNLLLTTPDEVIEKNWNYEEDSGTAMTESELVNLKISDQQNKEAVRGGHKLVSQTGSSPQTLSLKIASGEPVPQLLKQDNVVSFKVNLEKEQVELLNASNISDLNQLPGTISTNHPSYTIYRGKDNYYFIYSCPSGSKVKERMLYASNKTGFINHLREEDGLDIFKVLEIGDPDELELSELDQGLDESLNRPATSQMKFSKPRGPGRRR